MDDAIRPLALECQHMTAELATALSKAQEQSRTVAKRGRNTHSGYDYATADDMIAAGRTARAGTGLALVTAWSAEDVAPPEREAGQWTCAIVTIRWALVCAGSTGRIEGSAQIHAIASKLRAPDKAIAAAVTYAEGFVERSLMRLDRAHDPDEVDQRIDEDVAPATRRSSGGAPYGAPRIVYGPHKGTLLQSARLDQIINWHQILSDRLPKIPDGDEWRPKVSQWLRETEAEIAQRRAAESEPDAVARGLDAQLSAGQYPESAVVADDDIPY